MSDPYFEIRKAHGDVKDAEGNVLFPYTSPGDDYMGTKEQKSQIIRSDIVKNSLNPVWLEVEVDLDRHLHI
jgi:hypothetical protein